MEFAKEFNWSICSPGTCGLFAKKAGTKKCIVCTKSALPSAPPVSSAEPPPPPQNPPSQAPPGAAPPVTAIFASNLPPIYDVFGRKVNTIEHVPSSCRATFSRTWQKISLDVCETNTVDRWTKWAMFPKCILAPLPLGGAKNKRVDATIMERLEKWNKSPQGPRDLWDETKAHKAPSSMERTEMDAKVQGATKLAKEGHYGRAIARLMSDGSQPKDAVILEAMRKLHPKSKAQCPGYPPASVKLSV